jgi:hemerythrin-like domain-containing protein
MIKPLEILMNEHSGIEQTLSCLEKVTVRCPVEGKLDEESTRQALDFRTFADCCHHGKEEGILFPLLARRGLVRQYGPSGVMAYEHNQGRRHIRHVSRAAGDGGAESPDAVQRFLDHARTYVLLVLRPIDKEDPCLFPWVERNLTAQGCASLQKAFDVPVRTECMPEAGEPLRQLAGPLTGGS